MTKTYRIVIRPKKKRFFNRKQRYFWRLEYIYGTVSTWHIQSWYSDDLMTSWRGPTTLEKAKVRGLKRFVKRMREQDAELTQEAVSIYLYPEKGPDGTWRLP